ncbi:hypothetical protein J437_LFUL016472 [Ladona fulva]|uniref:Transferrin-like domain-containing protein n=1 Tax=Ladona fulva TaxID=123851 RepID=A0A8K0P4R2_LADFU|nr:hypothetical protein J437_LFUL016472 [Ladona fulva]
MEGLLPGICPHENAISSFFSEACVPGLNSSLSSDGSTSNLVSLCNFKYDMKGKPPKHLKDRCCGKNRTGEVDAFRCLVSGGGEVAIVEMETVNKNADTHDKEPWAKYMSSRNSRILCLGKNDTKNCHIGWSPKGLVVYNKNLSSSRFQEVYEVFLQMDKIFGKHYKMPNPAFQMYGPFDGKNNVIFQDSTHSLVSYELLKRVRPLSYNYEEILKNISVCSSLSIKITSARFLVGTVILSLLFF